MLERYELLYEAGLVSEAARDLGRRRRARWLAPDGLAPGCPGAEMAVDHRRILATAIGRLRGKIKYRPVVFELMPPAFTLLQLQRTVEALAGVRLHKQNFRRLVEQQGLVEETGEISARTGGRPARLVRFRREVLLERPAPACACALLPRRRGSMIPAGRRTAALSQFVAPRRTEKVAVGYRRIVVACQGTGLSRRRIRQAWQDAGAADDQRARSAGRAAAIAGST